MRKVTKQDILNNYDILKQKLKEDIKEERYQKVFIDFDAANWYAYNFNFFYRDDEMEGIIIELSEKFLGHIQINGTENRIALVVKTCLDNRGLQQQYFRALQANGAEVLFVIIDDSKSAKETVQEVSAYEKAQLLILGDSRKRNDILKAKQLQKALVEFKPSMMLIHSMPGDAVTFMVCHSITGVETYNINLTDHAYWPGASFIDYNIEFRNYGKTVSEDKRGLKSTQLLELPYYPIGSKYTEFKGFVNVPSDKVKIFTGGSFYKMFGEDNAFFKLMDKILAACPNAIILLAGNGDMKKMKECLNGMANKNRVYYIGVRSDIDAVYDNIDIYLGTYPFPGGLMSQYACQHSKPILSMRNPKAPENNIESLCNHQKNAVKSFSNDEELVNYAKRLVNDETFRLKEGQEAKNAMLTPEKFNSLFWHLLQTKENQWNWPRLKIDYANFSQFYLDEENNYGYPALKGLINTLRFDFIKYFPQYLLPFLKFAVDRAGRKLSKALHI